MQTLNNKSFGYFIVLWAGEWTSSIGSGLTAFVLGVYVYQMTQTASSVAMVTLCAFLPSIMLGPIGGVLADRFDRRLMMIVGDLFSAFGLVYILITMLQGEPSIWQICLGVTVMSLSATGMLIGSLIIGIFSIKSKYILVLTVGLAFAGFFFSLLGLTTNIYFITLTGFLFFASLPFINTSADVMIRKTIVNEAQGRAWGLVGIISQTGYVAAYAISGTLADHVFNPLMQEGGRLASTIGKVIGIGEGRGTGLLFIVLGMCIVIMAFIIPQLKSIRTLEKS